MNCVKKKRQLKNYIARSDAEVPKLRARVPLSYILGWMNTNTQAKEIAASSSQKIRERDSTITRLRQQLEQAQSITAGINAVKLCLLFCAGGCLCTDVLHNLFSLT